MPLLLAFGCCREVACHGFTADEREWMPYNNGDTLVFKNFKNDSIISFHTYSYQERQEQHKDVNMLSCYDGCINAIQINLATVNGYSYIGFNFFIVKTHMKGLVDSFYVIAGLSYDLYEVLSKTNNPYNHFELKRSIHRDSITIANQVIYDVFEYESPNDPLNIKKMWVKKGMGILKFVFGDDQSFELIKYKKNENN